MNDGISAPPHPRGAGGALRFGVRGDLSPSDPLPQVGVTGCYKSVEGKGKVLPLFADKLNNEGVRPLEEA